MNDDSRNKIISAVTAEMEARNVTSLDELFQQHYKELAEDNNPENHKILWHQSTIREAFEDEGT